MNKKRIALSALASIPLFLAGCAGTGNTAQPEEHYINHEVSDSDKALAQSKAPLTGDSALLYVNGMGCPLCASNLDMQLERVKGVTKVFIDLGQGTASVTFAGEKRPSPYQLSEAVADAGFTLVRVTTLQASGGTK